MSCYRTDTHIIVALERLHVYKATWDEQAGLISELAYPVNA